MKKYLNILFQLLGITAAILSTQCANIRAPQGGPKDTLAPKLLYSSPFNKQTIVKSNEVILIFDSDINVDNLEKELIVTPVMNKKYKVKTTYKTVKIKFNEDLFPNTTYTLTFRKGITDINENNVPKNFKLIFTTGTELDSFQIKGQVKKLITESSVPNAVLSFYKTDIDTISEKSIPIYQTETNETGNFLLENIKEDDYLIYAFNDVNKDYKYNQATEQLTKFGYSKGNNDPLELEIFNQDKTRNRITDKEQKGKSIICELTRGAVSAQIRSLKDSIILYNKISGKQLEIFPNIKEDTLTDTLKLEITTRDSANYLSKDTIQLKFQYKLTPQNLVSNFYENKINQKNDLNYILETSIPILKIIDEDIEIKIDKIKYTLSELKYSFNENRTKINIPLAIKPKDSIKVKIQPNAITSLYNDTNALISRSITFGEQPDKGILAGIVKTKYPNYILEILQDNYAVKESYYNAKQFKIFNLDPATYLIRLIEDRNANGKWDFEINGKIDPERITYFKEKIIMKANWEINDVLISEE